MADITNIPDVGIAETLRNPGSQFTLSAHRDRFPTESFDREEAQLFEQQMNDLIANMPSSVLGTVLQQRQETIAKVAALAKHDIEGNNFGGINAGDNEIGFSILRPGHIRRDPSNGNIQNTWEQDPGATGYVDWIGDGGSNNFVVDEDMVILTLGLTDQELTPTPISAMNVDQFGRNMDMLPRDLNDLRYQDNTSGIQFAQTQTLVGQENDNVHVRLRYDENITREPRLFGLTFAKGEFLNNEDYSVGDYDTMS